jgi:hypothetical protein
MSDSEVIALAVWLALLAIGLWLMFSPIRKIDGVEQRVEPVFPERILSPTTRGIAGNAQADNDEKAVAGGLTSAYEQQAPPVASMDAEARPEVVPVRNVETPSVEMTSEVNVGGQDPERNEIAHTQNEGKRVEAKSREFGLRHAEVARAKSGPESRSEVGAAVSSGGVESTPKAKERASASVDRNASRSSILDSSAVADFIKQKTPLGSVVSEFELLSDFYLRKHVTPDEIANVVPSTENVELREPSHSIDYNFFLRKHVTPEEIANVVPSTENVEVCVTSYFSDYHHRYSVAVSDVLKNVETDAARRYLETRRFPHDYVVSVFDEALVVTLSPKPGRHELLVISPVDSDYEEFFGSLLSSSRITELFVGAPPERDGELRLYRELDRVLEHFRVVGRG